jgi:hypothetical protein
MNVYRKITALLFGRHKRIRFRVPVLTLYVQTTSKTTCITARLFLQFSSLFAREMSDAVAGSLFLRMEEERRATCVELVNAGTKVPRATQKREKIPNALTCASLRNERNKSIPHYLPLQHKTIK